MSAGDGCKRQGGVDGVSALNVGLSSALTLLLPERARVGWLVGTWDAEKCSVSCWVAAEKHAESSELSMKSLWAEAAPLKVKRTADTPLDLAWWFTGSQGSLCLSASKTGQWQGGEVT